MKIEPKAKYFLFQVLLISCLLLVYLKNVDHNIWFSSVNHTLKRVKNLQEPFKVRGAFSSSKCPSVLNKMVQGYWKQKQMTTEQEIEMKKFLQVSRSQHKLPVTLQREDSRCGNIGFPRNLTDRRWIRAICDPYGNTPCCYDNKCTARSVDQCRCEKCYDMRTPIHAEYSDFIPYDSRCTIRKYSHTEACQLLDGATIYFSGDSLIRHIYTAMLLFLRNNIFDGALRKGIPKEVHDQCTGMYMFTERICRLHLDPSSGIKDLCGGKFTIMFQYHLASRFGGLFVKQVESIKHANKSLVVFGIGIHDGYNIHNVTTKYIEPVVRSKGKNTWPKLLWATPHHQGILKRSEGTFQSIPILLNFIGKIDSILQAHKVPSFNTFNMTAGVMSFDGTHFGLGLNMWKVQLLLNYIQELKDSGSWN